MEMTVEAGKIVAEGSGSEIGRAYAAQLRKNRLLREINIRPVEEEVTGEALKAKERMLEAACPGIMDEVAGLCGELEIHPGRLLLFQDFACKAGQCGQAAALPAITADGHLYVGRSYEFNTSDELCLCVTRREGYPRHMGFSLALFGREDGMNDQGLCVTMSSCAFLQPATGEGLWFPIVLRALLDRCATVAEASDLLQELPICSNDNFLLADASGHARVAEIHCADGKRSISFRDGEQFLAATNHYQNPDMLAYDNHRGLHSALRYKVAVRTLSQENGRVDRTSIKALLERRIPDGFSCPFYQDGLGTLHSMVFDVTAGKLEVSLGMPSRGSWKEISWDAPCENTVAPVTVRNEFPDNPDAFWVFLPPGKEL